jgi:hypothetical protein
MTEQRGCFQLKVHTLITEFVKVVFAIVDRAVTMMDTPWTVGFTISFI